MKICVTILLFISLLFACEERYSTEFGLSNTGLLTVEAVLTNENMNQKIKLSLPYQQLNGTSAPATGATVRVQEGTGVIYTFAEDVTNPGIYHSPPFQAVVDMVYTLQIIYNGQEYRAQDSSVPVAPLTPMQYQKVNEQYELILNNSGEDPYYIDHQVIWENTSACVSGNSCEGRIVFYDLKSIDVNEIYKPAKEQFLFPAGTTVTRKKYSVSPAYRTFLRSILSETEWRGGVFDVDRANATTNLSKGAIGFFAVTTVVSDVTVVN
jgi:Domain of unknown function (DUF4249)